MSKARTDARPVTKMIVWGARVAAASIETAISVSTAIWHRETSTGTRATSPTSSPRRPAGSVGILSFRHCSRMTRTT